MKKFKDGQKFKFEMPVDFEELYSFGGIGYLDDYTDHYFDEVFSQSDFCIDVFHYKPVEIKGDNVIIEVSGILDEFTKPFRR